jgi:hypothetical protein
MSELNLRKLRPSRSPLRAGDIFAMQLPSDRYLFGRVIEADIPRERAPMPKSNLIYIYRYQSEEPDPTSVSLVPSDLLIPPVFTNHLAWSRGYFETLGHAEITQKDLLPHGSFWDAAGACFVDADGNRLPREVPPAGDWGLSSYRWIDDRISEALGIPRASE